MGIFKNLILKNQKCTVFAVGTVYTECIQCDITMYYVIEISRPYSSIYSTASFSVSGKNFVSLFFVVVDAYTFLISVPCQKNDLYFYMLHVYVPKTHCIQSIKVF